MLDLLPYAGGLLLAISSALVMGWKRADRSQLWRCAGIVFAVWLLGLAFITLTENYDPWEFNLFVDSLAMLVILWHPAGRAQVALGLFYIAQMSCHLVYGARELAHLSNDMVLYYNALTVLAWGQLLVLGGWSFGVGGAISTALRGPDRHVPRWVPHIRRGP